MPRTGPCGSVGSSSSLGGPSSSVQVAENASGPVSNALTPGPSRCVASSVLPSAAQASAQGLRGPAAAPAIDRSAAWTCTTWSSCEHATKTLASSALTSTPIGSEQTNASRSIAPDEASSA